MLSGSQSFPDVRFYISNILEEFIEDANVNILASCYNETDTREIALIKLTKIFYQFFLKTKATSLLSKTLFHLLNNAYKQLGINFELQIFWMFEHELFQNNDNLDYLFLSHKNFQKKIKYVNRLNDENALNYDNFMNVVMMNELDFPNQSYAMAVLVKYYQLTHESLNLTILSNFVYGLTLPLHNSIDFTYTITTALECLKHKNILLPEMICHFFL